MAGKLLRTKNMADNTIQAATDGNFEAEVLTASNSQPVMVDFWAEWCRPCHMLAPTVAEIAHDYAGKLKVMKLNVDEAMNSAGRYRVQGIPTLLLFKNRSEEHTSELQSPCNLVCRLLLEKKKKQAQIT